MNPLQQLLALPDEEKHSRGLLHTPTEIAQQPATWQATSKLFDTHAPDLRTFLRPAHEQKRTIVLIGAGTSDYIGRAVAPLFRRQWGCEVLVTPSTDLLTGREELLVEGQKYLWISFSRSGDSPEGVAVLEQALEDLPDVTHLVISCNRAGRMSRLAEQHSQAHAVILDDAVNDRSLAMTSSFTNMVLFAQRLSGLWSSNDFAATLDPMTRAAEYLLDAGAQLAATLAKSFPQRACFVGAGVLAAAARESALKLLELTAGRIETMHESSLGLRHGPMSALNLQTVLTGFVSSGARCRKYDLDLLQEVRAKQTVQTIVSIGAPETPADHALYCDAFSEIHDAYRAPADVIFGQLFGLFASMECGCKPDTPSPQGVISRVVQPFTIYR